MKIKFERWGGFTGLLMKTELDTESMASDDARYFQEMIDVSDFFNLPAFYPPPEKGADYFQYRLTVESKGRQHSIEVNEPSVTSGLRPLIDRLMKEARKNR